MKGCRYYVSANIADYCTSCWSEFTTLNFEEAEIWKEIKRKIKQAREQKLIETRNKIEQRHTQAFEDELNKEQIIYCGLNGKTYHNVYECAKDLELSPVYINRVINIKRPIKDKYKLKKIE